MTTILTHNASFHIDDVFAVATMLLLYPEAKIIRSRDENDINQADVVVDTGGIYDPSKMRFDHHQPEGAGKRENGIPYASFGLVWKEFGEELAGVQEKEMIDLRLVAPIDAIDNGVDLAEPKFSGIRDYSLRDFIYSFVDHSKKSDPYLYEVFIKVVGIAKDLLEREIMHARSIVIGMEKVKKIVDQTEDKRIIILDEDLPWGRVLETVPESVYVVYPRVNNSWGIEAVRKDHTGFELRKPLPSSWGGKKDQDLVECTGVPDALFAHRVPFKAAAHSREGAIKLAQIALNL